MSYDNLAADPNLLTSEALPVPSDQVPIMKFGMAINIHTYTHKHTQTHTLTLHLSITTDRLLITGPDTYTSLENYR